jgi:hypothetical protein
MPLSNYTELQAAVLDWMERSGQTGQVADWITLAEARLNRELGPVETNASRTGTIGDRSLSISALSIVEPVALWIADPGTEDEQLVDQMAPANMAYVDSNGRPTQWCIDSETNIKLNRPCDVEYAFRFRFRERFALATSSTNWLLTNHPDVYLAASIVWGNAYNQDIGAASAWKSILDEAIPSIRNTIAKSRKGTLKVDPALSGRYGAMSFTEWQAG